MKLDDWLKAQKMTSAEFARSSGNREQAGCSQISAWREVSHGGKPPAHPRRHRRRSHRQRFHGSACACCCFRQHPAIPQAPQGRGMTGRVRSCFNVTRVPARASSMPRTLAWNRLHGCYANTTKMRHEQRNLDRRDQGLRLRQGSRGRPARCSEATAARYRRCETLPSSDGAGSIDGAFAATVASALLRMAGSMTRPWTWRRPGRRRELHLLRAGRKGPVAMRTLQRRSRRSAGRRGDVWARA